MMQPPTPARSLLVRPVAHPGEDPDGYLARAARAHGLTRRALGDGIDLAAALSRSGRAVPPGWSLPRSLLRRGTTPACTQCIGERGLILQAWSYRPLTACPHHGVVLLDRCAKCGRQLTPWEHLADRCECGCSLSATPRTAIPEGQKRVLKAIWSAACDGEATGREASLAGAAYKLLLVVARARRGRDVPMKGRTELQHAAEWLERSGMSPPSGEDGIETWLSSLRETIHLAAASVTLRGWLKDEQIAPTLFSELPLARWVAALDQRGAPRRRRQHVPFVPPEVRVPVRSVGTLAGRLGLSPDFVVKRARQLQMEVLEHQRGQRLFRFVHARDADRLRNNLRDQRRVFTGKVTGLGRTGVRRIRLVYRSRQRAADSSRRAVDPRFVLDFIEALEAAPSMVGDGMSVPLDGPWIWQRHDTKAIDRFIAELYARKWPLRRASRPGLGRFEVPVEVVARLRSNSHAERAQRLRHVSPCQLPLISPEPVRAPHAHAQPRSHHAA